MKTIVILGSSTAAGVGSSEYSGDPINHQHKTSCTSWAGIMSIRSPFFSVINQSISGSATKNSIDRFHRDVPIFSPSYVIFATSIWNEENFIKNPFLAVEKYLCNVHHLIHLCETINATPAIHSAYPHRLMNSIFFNIIQNLHTELDRIFSLFFDFMTPVSDAFGHWLPSFSNDGIHPTDLGHAFFADSITGLRK